MAIEKRRIRITTPADPCPYWPAAYFLPGDEIVAALFYESSSPAGSLTDELGVLADETDASPVQAGWLLHILCEGSPGAEDPRADAAVLDVLGDLSVSDALRAAWDAVTSRGTVRGVTYEESRELLVWRPLGGWADSELDGTGA